MDKSPEDVKSGDKFAKRHIIITADHVPFENLTECVINNADGEESDDGVYMMNMERTINIYRKWCDLLPRIRPFYAIKCNPDPVLVRLLHLLGTGFDCASKEEIELALSVGSKPSDIIYAHPCKRPSYISYAAKCGVSKMTFDSKEELFKIKERYPDAEVLIRFRPTFNGGTYDCNGSKYGATVENWSDIIAVAKNLEVNVVGVSFHVGSYCLSGMAFETCIQSARSMFDQGEKLGYSFDILDIGGGFPGKDSESLFFKICHVINRSLEQHFPVSSGVEIIAEPGTYFACSPFTLLTHVTTVKEITKKEMQGVENPPVRFTKDGPDKGFMYYIDDGVFGSFNGLVLSPALLFKPQILKKMPNVNYPSCIWGEYLDAADIVIRDYQLPKLSVGDWLYFDEMGAYTSSSASSFNGFTAHKHVYYYVTMETWKKMDWKKDDFSANVVFIDSAKVHSTQEG